MVISPTLFNVYVNDIEDCIPQGTAFTNELVSIDSTSHMQDVMNHLEVWAEHNKMELNVKSRNLAHAAPEPITIGGKILERVKEFKLLGVTVQNDSKWNAHVTDRHSD